MKIKMKVTKPLSEDGIAVKQYVAGEIYEVSDELAATLIGEDWAAKTKSAAEVAEAVEPDANIVPLPATETPSVAEEGLEQGHFSKKRTKS